MSPVAVSRERLQKVLARCGVGSRRSCEDLIREGRVTVDGERATLGDKIDPENAARIEVDGDAVELEPLVSYVVHKPVGHVCSQRGQGKPRVVDLVPDRRRIVTAGRLDADSSGLVILTNDGSLVNYVTHPRYEIPKTYRVTVTDRPTKAQVRHLEEGVDLQDGLTLPARVNVRKRGRSSVLDITVREGRNRMVRRMVGTVGLQLVSLRRIRIGPVKLEDLPEGSHRPLTEEEKEALVSMARDESRRRGPNPDRG